MTLVSGVSLYVHLKLGAEAHTDWTIRELAMYDLPAMVEHVCRETGYDKV